MKFVKIGNIVLIFAVFCSFSFQAKADKTIQNTLAYSENRVFTKSYHLFFRINKWDMDTSFLDNGATIRRMKAEIDSLMADGRITSDSILIVSAASPDGRNAFNVMLSEKRGETAEKIIKELYPEFVTTKIIRDPIGEDWATLRKITLGDENIPMRDELLEIIDSDLDNDAKERKFRAMKPTFRYIIRNHVNLMRAAAVTINISVPNIVLAPVAAPKEELKAPMTGSIAPVKRTVSAFAEAPAFDKKMILAARTNLLVPALNVGIEVPIKTNWSVGVDYYYPWWLAKSNKYCGEMLGLFIDGKYWFGKNRTEEDKLTGHALGVYAGAGYYDYQKLRSGYQGEYIDVGVDYTYAIPVAKGKLRMEFNLGIGWIHTVARHYTPTEDYTELIRDPGIKHRKYNFFGPTRASVSFVVPIRVKVRKGGDR